MIRWTCAWKRLDELGGPILRTAGDRFGLMDGLRLGVYGLGRLALLQPNGLTGGHAEVKFDRTCPNSSTVSSVTVNLVTVRRMLTLSSLVGPIKKSSASSSSATLSASWDILYQCDEFETRTKDGENLTLFRR